MRYELPILNYYLLCYFNTTILLKDEVINIKDIIIKNLQDGNKQKIKLIDLETRNNNVDKYSRRNNVEIAEIPQSVSDSHLEEKDVDILKAIDINITSNEIEACDHLGKEKKNVWVINRKHCLKALQNKKKLKSIDKNAIGIPNSNLLVSENFTLLNSKLVFNCRELERNGETEKCYNINGMVHIAKRKKLMKIYHLKYLQQLFQSMSLTTLIILNKFFFVFGKFLCY